MVRSFDLAQGDGRGGYSGRIFEAIGAKPRAPMLACHSSHEQWRHRHAYPLQPFNSLDAPGFTLDRIHAALERTCSPSDLSEDEQEIYFDLLGQQQSGRREAERSAFARELMNEAGNVGYDEAGHLVRTLGGGQVEVIEPASGQEQASD